MKRRALLALCATLMFFFAAPAIAAPDTVPLTDGVIKKIDPAGRITIAHGRIENLNMPPMTMRFKAETPALLKPWKEGDKIRFRAVDAKGVLTVISIEAAK
jgi:Cu(I)/Ag(I) efflux system periplasmic protein CusF